MTFSYPNGGYHHNADFSSGPPPTSCTQTAGPNDRLGAAAAHPADGSGLERDLHLRRRRDLHVSLRHAPVHDGDDRRRRPPADERRTTTTSDDHHDAHDDHRRRRRPPRTTTRTTPPTTTTATTGLPPARSPLAGPARTAVTMPAVQHGTAVHGSMRISPAGGAAALRWRCSPRGRRSASPTSPARCGSAPVTRRRLPARRVAFSVPLDRIARRALERAGQLTAIGHGHGDLAEGAEGLGHAPRRMRG